MEQATIIKRDGTKINLISKDPFRAPTSFSQEYGLKSDDYVKISLKSSDMLKFGIGDRIIIGSDTYTIRTNNTTEIVSDNSYTYELTFYGAMYDLMRQMYRNCDAQGKSDKSTFDLTYSLKDFAKVIIYNMERDYPGEWVLDENNVPDTDEKTITFDGQNCLQVLQTLCNSDNYDYDFLITQADGVHTLHLGKFGSVITPPNNESYFEVGKGKGLYKLKEDKVDDKTIITRLWVEGGSTNIRSEYRDYAGRLQLPYPQRANTRSHTLSDGTVIAAGSMTIGITDDTKRYFEDADLKDKIGSIEDYDKTDDIFPSRTGKVTAIGADVYSFVDDTMDFDLNEKDSNGTKWLIADTTAKITFTSGYLAGQQFELKKIGGYVHATKTFSLIKYTDERGMSFPSETSESFQIRVGDTYKITDINLPTAYENDAEEDLWFYGYDKFLQAKQARVQYTATFTEDFFIHHLPTDSTADIFHVGDYLPIKDTRFGVAKNIRITKVTRNLMKRYDYTLTVSDTNSETIESQIVDEVINHETIINRYGMKDPSKARRGWRTTEDLRNMVFDTDGYFDGTNIKPNSIDTNMLTVGSKSQQFVLINITLQANVNGLPNRFDASAGILAHLTIDEDNIKMWNLTATSVTLAESGGYYVYAKCSKSGNTGSYYITQEQLKFEPASDVDNYYFLIGMIGSLHADDNFRDFVTTYGFTRINGRTITTGRIVSQNGLCYLDLDNNTFQLSDAETLDNSTSGIGWKDHELIIKGIIVQNQGGVTAELGLYRGVYDSSFTYYKGDEVSYNNGSETATYRYINATPGVNKTPTDSFYWAVVAKGEQGVTGENGVTTYTWIKYADDVNGSGLSDNPTGKSYIGFAYNRMEPTESTSADDYLWSKILGEKGDTGDPGATGDYFEYRYAKNGSTSAAPSLSTSSAIPSGWATTMPTVGVLEYLWCTIAKKSSTGALLQNWSTPARVSPYDGVDGQNGADGAKGDKGDKGENPVLAFRGLYDAGKTYYGTNTRLDAVKYNGIYYIARIDAGSFSNILPTDTSKWNTFGAQLETIATNLLLAEGANIGDWFMSAGSIISTMDPTQSNRILLQVGYWSGSTFIYSPKIIIESSVSGGDYSMDTGLGSKIELDAARGIIGIGAKNPPSYSTGSSYMSPTGIFSNLAGTDAMPASSGYTHQGSIVGLGFANVNKNEWAFDGEDTIVAGIYGRAYNNGTAPAYGGFFYNLFAGGLTLGRKCISSTTTVYLSSTKSLVVGYTSAQVLVYLPTDAKEGTVILFKQWWTGYMRIYPRSGQKLYDDSTQNDYYDVGEGEMLIAQFTIGYITSGSTTTKVEAWLVNKFKY